MTRPVFAAGLLLLLAACSPDAPADPPASDRPAAEAPLTFEDSAAALRAQIDSMRGAIAETQAEIDEGFRVTDSLRGEMDALGREVEATRRRAEGLER